VLRIGSLGGFGCECGLHHETHLREFLEGGVVEEEEEFHWHSEDGRGVFVEITAVTYFLSDDAHDLENLECGTQGGTGDAEVCSELAFGGQLGAGREQSFTEQLLKTEYKQLRHIFFFVEDVMAVAERRSTTFLHA
jgi:hypothetical protein